MSTLINLSFRRFYLSAQLSVSSAVCLSVCPSVSSSISSCWGPLAAREPCSADPGALVSSVYLRRVRRGHLHSQTDCAARGAAAAARWPSAGDGERLSKLGPSTCQRWAAAQRTGQMRQLGAEVGPARSRFGRRPLRLVPVPIAAVRRRRGVLYCGPSWHAPRAVGGPRTCVGVPRPSRRTMRAAPCSAAPRPPRPAAG